MAKRKTKRLRMIVEVSCPEWLNPVDARREVRTLINQQCFYGHEHPAAARWEEIGAGNFRAVSVRPVGSLSHDA